MPQNWLGIDPKNRDKDGEGMPNGLEAQYGLNPLANDAGADVDGDGVDNLTEHLQAGIRPAVRSRTSLGW